MAKIEYRVGDVTRPAGAGPKMLAHICNDKGGWGSGLSPLGKQEQELPSELGQAQLVEVELDPSVANMIG